MLHRGVGRVVLAAHAGLTGDAPIGSLFGKAQGGLELVVVQAHRFQYLIPDVLSRACRTVVARHLREGCRHVVIVERVYEMESRLRLGHLRRQMAKVSGAEA